MTRLISAAVAISILALAGCGSSSSSSSSGSPSASSSAASSTSSTGSSPAPAVTGGPVKLAADPTGALKFNRKVLAAKAGKVTIDFTNKAPLGHNMTVASRDGKVLGATPTFMGGTKTLTLNLKPGTYTFYCSVPGHRAAGMQGTLVVK